MIMSDEPWKEIKEYHGEKIVVEGNSYPCSFTLYQGPEGQFDGLKLKIQMSLVL